MQVTHLVRARLATLGLAATLALIASASPAPASTTNADLAITKSVDKASPNLMRACAPGEHHHEVTLNP